MNRCRTCVYPDTKPDLYFDATGQCSACINYAARSRIDWGGREQELVKLLDQHHGEVVVPSSGGKDSTYIVLKMLELGANVTVITAGTCHLTEIGRKNIDNLARYAKTIEVTQNRTTAAKLNRLGLELVGDISWREHVNIFTTPFRVAADIGVSLIMYGENSQAEYGGPMGSEKAITMTARWRSEFGGFLGLRPADLIGQEGITKRDMADYETAYDQTNAGKRLEAHFLGAYIPWDSHMNAAVAKAYGMLQMSPSPANYWIHENLDNAQTGLHDYMMYRKYGYGRASAQLSVDVRAGLVPRETALDQAQKMDAIFPEKYAGVELDVVLDRIGIKRQRLLEIIDQFTNWEYFRRVEPDIESHPILIT